MPQMWMPCGILSRRSGLKKEYPQLVFTIIGGNATAEILKLGQTEGIELCGFVENPYHHIHPPYHRGNQGHELVVLSSPAAISGEEYQRFRDYLERRVMADVYD